MPDYASYSTMTLEHAKALLQSFDCANPRNDDDLGDRILQEAVLTLNSHADYHIFGICSETIDEGYASLGQYSGALGDDLDVACPQLKGPVYIKYNPKTGLFHVDSYVGSHRGVLVSFQSAYEQGVNELYGHFPLDLFAPS